MKQKLTIVCASGDILERPESLRSLIKDLTAIKGGKILVHGGSGSEMDTTFASQMKVKVRRAGDDKPIISDRLIDVLIMVHAGLINKRLVALLQRTGVSAVGLSGADLNLLVAVQKDKEHGRQGVIRKVNTPLLQQLLESKVVPVLCPIAYDSTAQPFYLDEREITSVVARVLALAREVSIIYLTDRHGVLMNDNDPNSVIANLSRSQFNNMKETGLIEGDAADLVESAFASIDHGVSRVFITSVERLSHLEKATVIKP